MKRGTLLLLIVVVVLALLGAAAASMLHDGLSARAQPTALETAIARGARKMAAPAGAHHTKNPVADSPAVQREARLHFADHCAICHGNDGSGDTMIGRGEYPKPPDLRAAETQNLSDGDIFWIIENGIRLTGMPAFGGDSNHEGSDHESSGHFSSNHAGADHDGEEHGSQDTWKLVHFIRHLPALTAEERLEMEKYNPKGPDDREEEKKENDFLNAPATKPPSRAAKHPD